ncbi:isochorismatase family protein [Bacteroides sp.]
MDKNNQSQERKAKDEFMIDEHTAIVMTDPQNDFLSKQGKGWGLFGENITKNGTVEHLRQIFDIAAKKNMLVFISPHYYYKHDHEWIFEGPVEKMMHEGGMFERKGQLTGEGFEGSGADWLDIYKPYINNGNNVIVTAPHKLFGPENNDLILQLRKRGINKVIICGMSGNLCAESHLRELQERGFEAAVVFDATASAKIGDMNADDAAWINFTLLGEKVYTTAELVKDMQKR